MERDLPDNACADGGIRVINDKTCKLLKNKYIHSPLTYGYL